MGVWVQATNGAVLAQLAEQQLSSNDREFPGVSVLSDTEGESEKDKKKL